MGTAVEGLAQKHLRRAERKSTRLQLRNYSPLRKRLRLPFNRIDRSHESRERRTGRLNVGDCVIGLREEHLIEQALTGTDTLDFREQSGELQGDG